MLVKPSRARDVKNVTDWRELGMGASQCETAEYPFFRDPLCDIVELNFPAARSSGLSDCRRVSGARFLRRCQQRASAGFPDVSYIGRACLDEHPAPDGFGLFVGQQELALA
jgi:hypothetical protein